MEPLIGSVLDGRFGIDAYLGGGSMADVYRGLDLEQDLPVAVKVLRPAMTQSFELVESFRREADALARLAHPNIVRQYGAGRDGDYVYIAMQFVDGHPLSAELADAAGSMPLDRVLAVADDVCAALSYAHEHGIVHRDIKPGNILIDASGRAILTDFGIAKVADAAAMTAFAIGTPAYMSPEQCRGQAIDGRTDIYAFACVLYEMLASVKPFRGERTQYDEGSSHAIVHEQMTREAPALRLYNPNLNQETEDVIRRAMAKSPARRQADARQLSEQLRSAAAHRGLRALRVVAPLGADVLLDGEVVGTGTVTLGAVPDGNHVIVARVAGHEPYRSAIAVPQTEVVFTNLVPAPQPEARFAGAAPMPQPEARPSPVAATVVPLPEPSAVSIDAATVDAGTIPPEAAAAPKAAQVPLSGDLRPVPTAAARSQEGREHASAVLPGAAPPAASGTTPHTEAHDAAAHAERRSLLWYVVPALALTGLGATAIAVGLLYFRGGGSAPAAALEPVVATPFSAAAAPATHPAQSTLSLSPPTAATSTPIVPATPVPATALPARPYAAIVARLEVPPDCLKQRVQPGDNGTVIQCLLDGTPVHVEQGPRVADAHSWWLVTAPDGRQGWMAEDYLLLSTRTIPVRQSDSNGALTLSLDAVDVQPSGDVVLQLSFTNHGTTSVRWQSDVNNQSIYLTDAQNRRINSQEVGGDFGRDLPAGLPPNATFHGWHRFKLADASYRGPLTLRYPNHNGITFQFAPP